MDDQNKNLILATALSLVVLIGWFALFPPPESTILDPNAEAVTQEAPVPSAAELAPMPGGLKSTHRGSKGHFLCRADALINSRSKTTAKRWMKAQKL
jgi:hypothetical protein